MAKNSNPREQALSAIEEALIDAGTNMHMTATAPATYNGGGGGSSSHDTSVDDILQSVSRITDMAHSVALKQCARAREVIETAARESLHTIGLLEETINMKRTGTHKQFKDYLEAVRSATVSADDVRESTRNAISLVRGSVDQIAEQVLLMPEAPPPNPPKEPQA